MFLQFKNAFWAFCLLVCFPLYSLGQMLLFLHDQNHKDFYIGLTKYSSSWINSHLILMLSLLLMIPAYLSIGAYLKNRNYPIWFGLSFFFLILCIFAMFLRSTCTPKTVKLKKTCLAPSLKKGILHEASCSYCRLSLSHRGCRPRPIRCKRGAESPA